MDLQKAAGLDIIEDPTVNIRTIEGII